MKDFLALLEEIIAYSEKLVKKNDLNGVFFRGINRASYSLTPGLARVKTKKIECLENRLYYDFVQYGGHLIPPNRNTWDILFLMQHYGIPTRLLDWSESLLTALFFAIKGSNRNRDAAIWALDPYALNNKTIDEEVITFFDVVYPKGYYNYFIDEIFEEFGTFPNQTMAVGVNPPNQRIVAQKGVFTFHNEKDFREPLELTHPKLVKKFIIDKSLFKEAKMFLSLSGYNEFTLFPDLDGLSRHIKTIEI